MANRKQHNPSFSKDRLKEALDYRGYTIPKLCKEKNIGISERQAWRYWKEEEMPADILDNIARELNVSVDYISGEFDISSTDDKGVSSNTVANLFAENYMHPSHHPYFKVKDPLVIFSDFFDSLFETYHITKDNLSAMSSDVRLNMMSDIDTAIIDVFEQYFIGYKCTDISTVINVQKQMHNDYSINVFDQNDPANKKGEEQLAKDLEEMMIKLLTKND